jgi:mannose/cellobiose epimerase-like protein (N-acyl-D-glucosamine 2-epimerase family)
MTSFASDRLQQAASRLESWCKDLALPLWADRGFDPLSHSSYERLLPDGSPDRKADVRVRVQARQIFVYAFAQHMGWYSKGRALVANNLEFIERFAVHPEGGFVHLLDCEHRVIDSKRDLYDHAFFLLAYAWCHRAFGMSSALQKAAVLADYLDRSFGSALGGWLEGDYPTAYRRQNPHMHMLEAFLALHDASGDRRWLEKAEAVVRLFERRFYDPERKIVLEYFTHDWNPLPGEKGKLVEPGHMMEWVWLLRWYESKAHRPVTYIADPLYAQALAMGARESSGLLVDAVRSDGRVLSATKRCWPQTEYIKASIAQARAGRRECEEHAAAAIDRLFRYYLDEVAIPGLYLDRRDADDAIITDPIPASTLYHLIVAAAEAAAYCGERAGHIPA